MKNKYVLTQDGSYTLYSSKYSEHYHSVSGAYTEALEKYIKPLEIKNGDKILDFCFGLGYNSFLALNMFSNLEILALENDENILKEIENFPYPIKINKTAEIYRNIYKKRMIKDKKGNILILIFGDAKETVKKLNLEYFDNVLFDPFSFKKAPELWSEEIFSYMYKVLKRGGKLATFSCAKVVRENMKKAGFRVFNGPIVGRKSPSTIAIKE